MFEDLGQTLLLLSLRDRVFLALAAATAVMLLVGAAVALSVLAFHRQKDREAARWHETERRLEPLILSVLSGELAPEAFRGAVGPREEARVVDYLVERFARNLRGRELELVRALALPFLDRVAHEATSPEPATRAHAIQTLATFGFEKYEGLFAEALADPSPAVSLVCARALARAGDARHAPAILANLDRLGLWSPSFLAGILASIGPDAVPHLIQRFLDTRAPPGVRAICADALRQIGVPEVADAAAEVLGTLPGQVPGEGLVAGEVTKTGDEREIVIQSLKLLAEWGHASHLPLIRSLVQRTDPVVRALAATALGKVGGPSDIPLLAAAVQDPSRWVAVHAAAGLRDIGAYDELARFAETHSDRAFLAREVMLE